MGRWLIPGLIAVLLIAGCGGGQSARTEAAREIVREDPQTFLNRCVREQQVRPLWRRNQLAYKLNVRTEEAPLAYCQRLTNAIAKK